MNNVAYDVSLLPFRFLELHGIDLLSLIRKVRAFSFSDALLFRVLRSILIFPSHRRYSSTLFLYLTPCGIGKRKRQLAGPVLAIPVFLPPPK